MEAIFIATGEVPVPAGSPAEYWVRLWGADPAAGSSRSADEWRITGARDVLEVIDWAQRQLREGWSYEIFAEATEPATRVDGTVSIRRRHFRLLGQNPEAPAAVETTAFVKTE
jgi:hypothetical protein